MSLNSLSFFELRSLFADGVLFELGTPNHHQARQPLDLYPLLMWALITAIFR